MKPVSKQVASISFSLVSPEEIKKIAVAKIVTAELYDVDGYPIDGGLMDLRLGAIDPGVRCRTCGGRLKECMGHFGYIELARPILHIKYVPLIELLLRCCCKKCGKLLAQGKTPAETIKKAKDTKKCVFCNAEQGKIKVERPYTFFLNKKRIFPSEIREMLTRINNEDYGSLGFNSNIRPEWAILTMLLFPPVTTRPSITLETGERSEDDLTHKLGDVLRSNQRLWENLNAGAPEVIIEDLWDLVQYHITTYIDNSIAQIPPARLRSGQLLESISERIKGKEGRIRHNLAGKRVNFSSRAVISPDPCIKFDEVGIPFDIASVLTVPEKVNNTNMEEMKRLITSDSYPKANYIIRPDGKRKRITQELKQEILDELQEGYTVERTVVDGDIVLFNRHPSLHRLSLMAHKARILDGKTFRMHPAVTFPYNADFDGDEMNVHIPQTEEARAEAKVLLHVNKHLMTPKNNSNVYGCIADALTGNYILSKKILEKKDAVQLLVEAEIEEEKIKKATLRQKVSGKEILSALLPKIDFGMRTKACLGRECKHFDSCMKEKCKNNAYLSIKKGEMIAGVLDKNSVGVEDGLLIKEIDKKGREETMHFLSSLFKLGTIFLTKTGLSIGIEDVRISESEEITKKIIENAEKKVFEIIGLYKNNTLELIPGKNAEETREIRILQILNAIRSEIGIEIKKRLREENPVSLMAKSGAGGNILYITQMSCSVGQQALWGKRIELGYKDRTLSFFKRNELSPLSRGFIYSNYVGGLKEHEFFFGAITGRDSLMDTALRTPKSGYFYRRISNALQDLKIEYDGTVRDASGRVVQFVYGDDGIDASAVHLQEKIAPGEAIGIITAQSFGEPSTQMTLNVFHFAGVSEMQVAMGLPRLLEIFDARKKPSTPAMEIYLRENNEQKAKEIARKIKQIRLKEVVREIVIDFANKNIEIFFDMKSLREAFLHIQEIAGKLKGKEASIKSKEKEISIRIKKDSIVIKTEADYKQLYKIKEKIKETIIGGVKGIEQVLPVKREKEYVVITSGSNLEEIFKIKGVNSERTTTNDITEIASVLGIEAARRAVIEETKKVMEKQGIDIDERHIKLVADAMTQNGGLKGITRVGIISEKSSILARASFETPIKHFVNASLLNAKDELKSVIENIILNQPVPVGTGLPGLLVKITGKLAR